MVQFQVCHVKGWYATNFWKIYSGLKKTLNKVLRQHRQKDARSKNDYINTKQKIFQINSVFTNYFHDSVNCYVLVTFTCEYWGHDLVSLEEGQGSRNPGPFP